MKLDDELARVLQLRIKKALDKARYYPAETTDTAAMAAEVVRPYVQTVVAPAFARVYQSLLNRPDLLDDRRGYAALDLQQTYQLTTVDAEQLHMLIHSEEPAAYNGEHQTVEQAEAFARGARS